MTTEIEFQGFTFYGNNLREWLHSMDKGRFAFACIPLFWKPYVMAYTTFIEKYGMPEDFKTTEAQLEIIIRFINQHEIYFATTGGRTLNFMKL